jgi:hypothetical protein
MVSTSPVSQAGRPARASPAAHFAAARDHTHEIGRKTLAGLVRHLVLFELTDADAFSSQFGGVRLRGLVEFDRRYRRLISVRALRAMVRLLSWLRTTVPSCAVATCSPDLGRTGRASTGR